MFIYNTLTEN